MASGSRAALSAPQLKPVLVFALLFLAVLLLHLPLLRLPYFWDEGGYYVPAARDLLLTGILVPHSTPSNAHPPLVMAYLAASWKIAGYSPAVTRTAMLLLAAFSLLGVFRLAQRVANIEVALAATACTAVYPVFFTQSSLAHLDLAAAGLTFWGLRSYVDKRLIATAVWFSTAAFAKETAILAPLALFLWGSLCPLITHEEQNEPLCLTQERSWKSALLLLPLIPLGCWYAYHYERTGFVFGNPEFFHYNVQATLHPLRIVLALGLRIFHVTGYLNLYVLTLAALVAIWLPPLHDGDRANGKRPRIALAVQFALLSVVVTYVVAMALVGGAVLARYMLPVVPLVIIVCVSTLWRRVRLWRGVIAIVVLAFAAALFVNPPYGFSLEDNLAYRDYIRLHQDVEDFLEARYPRTRVLTAWPASDELTWPYLGYVTRPMRVLRIENFTVEQLVSAADVRSGFDVALVFSTKYEPPHPFFASWEQWQEWKRRFFGYHSDVPPEAAAQILGGRLIYGEKRNGQWVGVIEMEQIVEARKR
jgi:hypothetical protein